MYRIYRCEKENKMVAVFSNRVNGSSRMNSAYCMRNNEDARRRVGMPPVQ